MRCLPSPLSRRCAVALGVFFIGQAVLMTGCSSPAPKLTAPTDAYLKALAATSSDGVSPLADRPADEVAAVQRVVDLYADFSEKNIREHVSEVYADRLFFRDGFKQFTSVEPLAAYMIRSTEPLRRCTFEFEPFIRRGEDYFLPWTMIVSLNRDKEDREDRALGISRIRFNEDGKVVFQQDYWDPTDVLYSRIPIANWLIRKVKSRL